MNWQQQWIDGILAEIPAGAYRRRLEAELRDHLDSQYRALTEAGQTPDQARAEALRAMGEPETLREEYKAAWRRSLSGRLEALRSQLIIWVVGCAVMFGAHLVVASVIGWVWNLAISLPADSRDPQIRMIRDTLGNLNNSLFFSHLLPLVFALTLGAYYLSREFQTSRHPVWQVSVGLSSYWTFLAMFDVWWEALDDHRTFWDEVKVYMGFNAGYYLFTFSLCILLGVVFGHMSAKMKRPSAA